MAAQAPDRNDSSLVHSSSPKTVAYSLNSNCNGPCRSASISIGGPNLQYTKCHKLEHRDPRKTGLLMTTIGVGSVLVIFPHVVASSSRSLSSYSFLLPPTAYNSAFAEQIRIRKHLGHLRRRRDVQSLTSVSSHVQAILHDLTTRVTVTQIFKNISDESQEISYSYPLDPSATVSSFHALVDGKLIKGILKEKQKAKEEYDDAAAAGHQAFLSEQVSEGTFRVSVGRLDPQKEVTLVLSYVAELTWDGGNILFTLPAHSPACQNIQFTAHVSTGYGLDKITSNVAITNVDDKVEATLSDGKPFELRVWVKEGYKPVGHAEKKGEGYVASFEFHPDMTQAEEDEEINTEIIFLIDCSGSMSGSPIAAVNRTVGLLLRSLPEACHFNVYNFGSTHRVLFKKGSKAYSSDTFDRAMMENSTRKADLGGTNLYDPMREILSQPPKEGYSRQIFLLTDGAVSNTEQCIGLATTASHDTRIFTFGIGNSVDRRLVGEIARKSHGGWEMIDAKNMNEAVMRQLNRAMKPAATKLKMSWGKLKEVKSSPYHLPPLFSGGQLLVYVSLREDQVIHLKEKKITGTLNGRFGKKDFSQTITIDLNEATTPAVEDLLITKLYGRSMIDSLQSNRSYLHKVDGSLRQNGYDITSEITKISLSTGVLSQHTAFVAVNEMDGQVIDNVIRSVDISSSTPIMGGGGRGGGRGGRGGAVKLRKDAGGSQMKRKKDKCDDRSSEKESMMPSFKLLSRSRSSDSEDAEEEKKAGGGDRLSSILYEQKSDGSFEKKVLDVIRIGEVKVKEALPEKANLSLFIAAIIVTYLEMKMGESKDVWTLSVRKAKNWMKKEGKESDVQLCLRAAQELVSQMSRE
ncbi:hypothetical protein PROFUN_09980 [Planoprotostelium fungivorum]|uniref:Uncharacterized protein n=1 Tax=Planoprotostelium fungivorum TaxID=1890364 RepID=A0A2P6NFJ8_9EUKA|nr:hypothetical protein PROFUN_09980 [Planoprotostelium fungivorum]